MGNTNRWALVQGANLFEVFSKYTNNFPRANHLLQQLIKKNRNFEVWLDEREKNTELRGRRLQDFLIMPVQRPPRYILLANVRKLKLNE